MAQAETGTRTAQEVARSAFEAFIDHDVDRVLSHWHPEGIQDWVALGVFRGHDEMRALFESVFAAMPDMKMTIEEATSDERRSAIQWRSRGTHTGTFMGIEPTGRTLEMRGVDVMEVEDGLIVKNTVYYDGAAQARALGLMPAQGSGAERTMISAFNGVTRLRKAIADRS